MDTIAEFKSGWGWLNGVLRDIVRAINRRTINSGNGIDIRESPSGVIIGLTAIPPALGGGVGLTADQAALLKALASDPGIGGTQIPTVPPNTSTIEGPVEWLPWKKSATTGWRLITYLETVTIDGTASNMLKDVWTWSGVPFNSRACNADTWGG